MLSRKSGILLHPTCLPSKYGIGELGGSIFDFLDFLYESGQKLWQILPLGPTGYGDSPYQSLSSYAGNPLLISIDELIKMGLLNSSNIDIPTFDSDYVEYGKVYNFKFNLLEKAFHNLSNSKSYSFDSISVSFSKFKKEQSSWLQDYSYYRALKTHHGEKPWNEWKEKFRDYNPPELKDWASNHHSEIELVKFRQWLFYNQWQKVSEYAHDRNIEIVGDLPIFVAYDSADTWANQSYFKLDDKGNLTHVAGVPPDYFSDTGQLWGNPLYKWKEMKKNNFQWWINRLSHTLDLVDWVRLDHFRGFEAYWQVPIDAKTAVNGRWVKGPDEQIFQAFKENFAELPIIAEDLGEITKEVIELKQQFGFPGMKILQYAFSEEHEPTNEFLPHNYTQNCLVYTGTHDNNTTLGWYNSINQKVKDHFNSYSGSDDEDIVSTMLRLAFSSVAKFVIIPLQDILREDSSARMNSPGVSSGNWQWRFQMSQIENDMREELINLTELYGR